MKEPMDEGIEGGTRRKNAGTKDLVVPSFWNSHHSTASHLASLVISFTNRLLQFHHIRSYGRVYTEIKVHYSSSSGVSQHETVGKSSLLYSVPDDRGPK